MSGASDKARFYQEQSVPELQELERKKIFTRVHLSPISLRLDGLTFHQDEISSVVKKRSDFEHKINARGSVPSDYARYAEYEMNLDALRRKRMKRLGVKATNHTGQRRILFVLDRATRRFQGDIGLWMQYLSYARKQKSNKKVSEILTKVLRLHPAKLELWIYAANYAMEERGDVQEARSYMQRGLRFCRHNEKLWLEYARLELIYIAKILERRKILGLDLAKEPTEIKLTEFGDLNSDIFALPPVTPEDMHPDHTAETADQIAMEKLESNPALSGAIPMAIFDAACQELEDDRFAFNFFDAVAEFDQLPCQHSILNHVLDRLRSRSAKTPDFLVRHIREPVLGFKCTSPVFPSALGSALSRINLAENSVGDPHARCSLNHQLLLWLLSYIGEEQLDPDIQKALEITLGKVWSQYQKDVEICQVKPEKPGEVDELLENFEARGMKHLTEANRSWALRLWPDGHSLSRYAPEQ